MLSAAITACRSFTLAMMPAFLLKKNTSHAPGWWTSGTTRASALSCA